MPIKPKLVALGALLCIMAASTAIAQAVYKCGRAAAPTYSDQPCSNHIVNTDEAPVTVTPHQQEAREQNRLMARAMRRLPDESAEHFATRQRRARLKPEDRAECARLETRMPVEQASVTNPDKEEADQAEAALAASRKRFNQLRC